MYKIISTSVLVLCYCAMVVAQVQIDKPINLSSSTPANAKITGIKDVSGPQDALSVEKFQNGSFLYGGTTGGSSTAYTVALNPAISGYSTGMILYFKAHAANGAGGVTIDVNGKGAKPIKKNGSDDLAGGDIAINQVACIIYDGTNFHLISQIGTNAKADAVTKGDASFTANDFNDNGSGNISIDYANGQKATASQPGFVTAADFDAFGKKWSTTGNTGANTGTTVGITTALAPGTTNVIGTGDANNLVMQVNNKLAGVIDHGSNGVTYFGYPAGGGVPASPSTSFLYNTAYGNNALYTIMNSPAGVATNGAQNTAIGVWALYSNTSGIKNTAMGINALALNTTGSGNVAIGVSCLKSNVTHSNNVSIGWQSMKLADADNNVGIGAFSLTNTTGGDNTAVGYNAGGGNSTGASNVFLGEMAGVTANSANQNTSGSNNTFLGYQSGPGTAIQLTNATAIGYQAVVNQSNSLVLGNNSVNVGIGTPNPLRRFTVQRTAGASSDGEVLFYDGAQWLTFNSNSTGGAYNPMVSAGDHSIIFSNNSLETGSLVIGPWSGSNKGIKIDATGTVKVGTLAGNNYRNVYADANGNLVTTNNLVLTSTAEADALNLASGFYTFNFPGSTGPQSLYFQNGMSGGIGYVRVFSSPWGSTAIVNFVDYSFPFTKFLIQTSAGANRSTAFFAASRLFNVSLSTTLSTGGTHNGYRVYIGDAGAFGIYNPAQLSCNWSNGANAVGAGYDTNCGTYPNGIKWGLGVSGQPQYSMVNTTWEIWIGN